MFQHHRLRSLLYSQTPKFHLLRTIHLSFNPFSTATPDSSQQSFTLSYLTNTLGLSPQDALKASKRINFTTPLKPNSVITFFKTHGFSNPQIQSIILKSPKLLSSNPTNTILPKFQFLASKGASPSDIAATVSSDLRKAVEEIKELGFHPSKYNFCVALLAKRAISKSQWNAKVDALKSWGCSEDVILSAFKKQPNFMLRSPDKLNAVMRFWVQELGWDPSLPLAAPDLFGFSLEKRLIPRASVVSYIKGRMLASSGAWISCQNTFCCN
ncbi:unnamed protein product [Vicia faba]|uniref:mTERF protein n=1 Tax=Vicia faba TaxID=3906 RepID=A0AAV0YMU6_VICFA|nr:unnamed protein product [Vicia faba]